jgi:SAM-dependent methyltransferase
VIERRLGDPGTLEFLDVGCGVGAMQRYVAPVARHSVGVDTSHVSIEAARELHSRAEFHSYAGGPVPFDDDSFDVVFAVNVVHHVDPDDRIGFFHELARLTRPAGLAVVFEQNPYNPLTRLAVSRCAFDDGVVLASRRAVADLVTTARMTTVESRYILFFPIDRRWARDAEQRLGRFPLGAQHMVAARPCS